MEINGRLDTFEMDDLLRLAELARLANPLARGASKKGAYPVLRCICGADGASDDETIECATCGCLLHERCVDEIGEIGKYTCPFCQKESAQALMSRGVDLKVMRQNMRATGDFETFSTAVTALNRSEEQIKRAAEWVGVVSARDDVYDQIEGLARVSLAHGSADGVVEELRQERDVMRDVAEVLGRMAKELGEFETPLIDALAEQMMMQGKA